MGFRVQAFDKQSMVHPSLGLRAKMTTSTANKEEAFQNFLIAFPVFRSTTLLDDLRSADYGRLDRLGQVSWTIPVAGSMRNPRYGA